MWNDRSYHLDQIWKLPVNIRVLYLIGSTTVCDQLVAIRFDYLRSRVLNYDTMIIRASSWFSRGLGRVRRYGFFRPIIFHLRQ